MLTTRAAIRRGLLLSLAWFVLVEADPRYLGYGLALVPVTVALSLRWLPAGPEPASAAASATAPSTGSAWRRLGATLGLLGWVAVQTVRGGIDVARRALARPVRVNPVQLEVPVDLTGGARAFALGVYCLMPGTMIITAWDGGARVHSLSADLDAAGTWEELQRRVALASGGLSDRRRPWCRRS